MNPGVPTSLSAGLFPVIIMSALLLVPLASAAQAPSTFFGSGGSANSATNAENVALGFNTLFSNTTGDHNTAIGFIALSSNTAGDDNTAMGWKALFSNTTGDDNTAMGWKSLYANATGYFNTAMGWEALFTNTTGYWNTAEGHSALSVNTSGYSNTANGYRTLVANTTGYDNTASGGFALMSNTSGSNNIALGYGAGQNLTTGSNNIAIGNTCAAKESGVIRIGTEGTHKATYIAGIDGVTASNGVAVYINGNGQLGTLTSSRRFKKDIHNMGSVSDKLMRLRPVTFRYKAEAEDGTHPIEYGLIAEEVAKVYPNLVQYDKAGKPFTIYYHLLTPMLLNELQKAQRQAEVQKAEITAQKNEIAAMKAAHNTEIAALKAAIRAQSAAIRTQSSELAALKQSQQQQLGALAKLTALVQTSQNKAPLHRAVYRQP